MDRKKENISKEAIIAEYLTGPISYRGLKANTESQAGVSAIGYWNIKAESQVGKKKNV